MENGFIKELLILQNTKKKRLIRFLDKSDSRISK